MCGIAGVWRTGPAAPDEIGAMTAVVAHRGPDASGTWRDDARGVALGHRRLAVVGLGEAGAQPMASRSGRWVLTYNGEVYNAPEVRARLEAAGHAFRGSSDTEVIVEALDAWGPEAALRALDGMFALGAWDRDEQRLVLARDRMGEKPLAYAVLDDGFAFASELRSLREVRGFDASIDPRAVALFLRFKYVPAPFTIHAGAAKLPPAHWLEVRDGGRAVGEPRPYWSYGAVLEAGEADPIAEDEAVDRLDAALGRAVRRQLRSDVPLGAFLSGGIDSSVVAALAAEATSTPLRTFTIGSPDPDLDESDLAREVAERIGADHTPLEVRPEDALALVPDLAAHWDEPFADSSQLPTLLVARLARRHVTVVLSGDGGDEVFGGYNRHSWLPRTWDRAGRVPGPVRRVGARVLGAPPPEAWDRVGRVVPEARRPRMLGLKAQKLALVVAAPDAADAYARLTSHWQEPGPLVAADEPRTLVHQQGRWPALGSLGAQLMAVDALTYLPDDVLVKVDRATMSIGLEARVPLLDREVVELGARLPMATKIRDGVGKWALREVLARRVPRALHDRPKSGFGIPIATWLRGPLRPWAEDLLAPAALAATPIVDTAAVRAAFDEHLSGRRDRSYELWDVLMLVGWLSALDPT